ncbi:amino acid ABC transporter permease [Streptomyces lincolnensis]|uniref:Polar amino acid ABC transporter, inner membrane subunit n=1 Tax=Streptomyces lincolnensis TaxID=1915 RepID=A0A1B1M269_STRLN|nr:amino acid ABC transporter permease [Streptomyces lincolnensis]ANS62522.1 polar amino acid ABC transporter, inner membrane subunit [Streptomyces lincolnensis]AXG51447.1 polar amino acid ABC transporter, inner membrane subunit [Streptomyces lincolnensis]QMV04503.1 ABC transporter permease subunit [Streptomyces lincolnensis]QMV11821.1 ABC transporter permease subunit [Streptomyces lincolnensis]
MDWSVIWSNRELYVSGLWATVLLSLAAIATGTLLGLVVAAVRTSRIPLLAQLARAYLEVFRGTPLLIQMLFIYFGAAYLGLVGITVFGAALLALTLYQGAYIAEIFRAGIEAVPRGQWEAARVLGLPRLQTFLSVVLPQTRAIVLPPLVGQYLSLIKDTSIAVVIGYVELVRQGQAVIDRVGDPATSYIAVAVLYFVICYPLSLLVRHMERKAVTA